MRIDIWSDVVCPWCYIGKRRLEAALERFPHADDVEVVWRSYQLDPSAPTGGSGPTETVAEHLGAKYGGGEAAGRQMIARVQDVATEVGLDYSRLPEAQRVGTLDAHRLLHAAGDRRGDLKEALLHAYFVDAENVADHDVLVRLATEVGLDGDAARAVLTSGAHLDDVAADVDRAMDLGASGVPFFVVDDRYGISGAQPVEVFTQVLEQAWAERRPSVTVVAGADGTTDGAGACEGDACAW